MMSEVLRAVMMLLGLTVGVGLLVVWVYLVGTAGVSVSNWWDRRRWDRVNEGRMVKEDG